MRGGYLRSLYDKDNTLAFVCLSLTSWKRKFVKLAKISLFWKRRLGVFLIKYGICCLLYIHMQANFLIILGPKKDPLIKIMNFCTLYWNIIILQRRIWPFLQAQNHQLSPKITVRSGKPFCLSKRFPRFPAIRILIFQRLHPWLQMHQISIFKILDIYIAQLMTFLMKCF